MSQRMKVLYVEDNIALSEMTMKIFDQLYNLDVDVAYDGAQGLELYQKNPNSFDLVITDIQMPLMDGLEMIEAIKQINPYQLTIIISSANEEKNFTKAMEIGVDRFLVKPYQKEDLDRALLQLIDQINTLKENKTLKADKNQALRLMQEYKKAVDESTIFSVGDLKGNIKYANKQFQMISGYSLEELVGKPHSIIRHPKEDAQLFQQMWQTLKAKKVWKGIIHNQKKSGESYYVDAVIMPIIDEKGKIVEYVGLRKDVTQLIEQKKEIEKLKDAQRVAELKKAFTVDLEQSIQNIPFASVLVAMKSGTILAKNNQFDQLFLTQEVELFDDLLLERSGYIYSDVKSSFLQRYQLSFDPPKVLLNIDEEEREFYIGVTTLKESFIVSFCEVL